MCKAPPAGHDSCTDYCDLNAKFCKSQEGTDKCLAYCRALSPEAKACHLRYVAIAGRCTVPLENIDRSIYLKSLIFFLSI